MRRFEFLFGEEEVVVKLKWVENLSGDCFHAQIRPWKKKGKEKPELVCARKRDGGGCSPSPQAFDKTRF